MKYAIINYSLVAVRKAPTEKSEMINQLLLGEEVIIHRTIQSWMCVESVFDGCSGWVNRVALDQVEEDEKHSLNNKNSIIVPRLNSASIPGEKNSTIHLMPGSRLLSFNSSSGDYTIGNQTYKLANRIDKELMKCDRRCITDTALSFLNAPFLWGGRSPFGTDSTGMIQNVGKIHGLSLPREAAQQVNMGLAINFIEEAKPGDLAFFDNDDGEIIHAGIMVEKGKILHAFGSVRIDAIDHQGIFREDTGEYTHQLRVVKNIIDQESD